MYKDKLAFTKSKWYGYLTNIVIAISVALIVLIIVNAIELQKFLPITNLEFQESEWIKISSANLYTRYQDPTISPNDQIFMILNVTNKVPHNILVEPSFHTYFSGNPTDIQSGEKMTYGHYAEGKFQSDFFPKFEGLNIVQVALKISYSNGTFLTYQNATTTFDVISKSDELQIQQNYFLLAGVIISSVIGGGTLTALYFNRRTSKEEIKLLEIQNHDLKEQHIIQNRPWISLVPKKTIALAPPYFQMMFENYGNTAAINIETLSLIRNGEITEEDFIGHTPPSPPVDISPKEQFAKFLKIPDEILKIIKTSENIHIGILLQYEFENMRKGRSLIVAKWIPSTENIHFTIKKLS